MSTTKKTDDMKKGATPTDKATGSAVKQGRGNEMPAKDTQKDKVKATRMDKDASDEGERMNENKEQPNKKR